MPQINATEQTDYHVTDFELRPGNPLPFGASVVNGGVNFSIYSHNATACTLMLFEKGAPKPLVEIPIPPAYRIGSVYSVTVMGLDHTRVEYAFRMDGPREPRRALFRPESRATRSLRTSNQRPGSVGH